MTASTRVALYAEDCGDDAFLMKRAFVKAQFDGSLIVVPNGAEAICYLAGAGRYSDRAASPLPSLVLLDVKMPRVDGFDVLRWIRLRPGFNELPVVMFTYSGRDSDIASVYSSGANCVLVKPANADRFRELAEDLSKVCSGELPVSASSIRGAISDPRNQ